MQGLDDSCVSDCLFMFFNDRYRPALSSGEDAGTFQASCAFFLPFSCVHGSDPAALSSVSAEADKNYMDAAVAAAGRDRSRFPGTFAGHWNGDKSSGNLSDLCRLPVSLAFTAETGKIAG